MNIEHSDEDFLESKPKTSQDRNQAQVKKGLSEQGQRIKAKRKKRLNKAEKQAQKIKEAEARAREERRVTLLQEAQANQEKRKRQAEAKRIKEEHHRRLCELWIEQQSLRQRAQNAFPDINKQDITKLSQEIAVEAKHKPQERSIHEIPIQKISLSKELTSCPYCQCLIRSNNLPKHISTKCPKTPINIRHKNIEQRKESMLKNQQKISLNSGQCSYCGRAAVPGSFLCYSCS